MVGAVTDLTFFHRVLVFCPSGNCEGRRENLVSLAADGLQYYSGPQCHRIAVNGVTEALKCEQSHSYPSCCYVVHLHGTFAYDSNIMSEVIQWGHDLSAMNTRKNIPPGWASSVGFNGATTFRSWILKQ